MKKVQAFVVATALASLTLSVPAYAGAPYVTDDPIPPDPGAWEVYSFVEGVRFHDATEAEAGFDINYGAAKDLQVTIGVPLGYEDGDTTRARTGLGDVEVGLKYIFLHEDANEKGINLAFYPTITLPTGERGFTSDKVTAFFPLWTQKDTGPWSVFGGGGYTINPGAGNKDFWSGGIAVTRDVAPGLNLGVETYFETENEVGGKFLAGAGIGVEYELSDRWALLAGGGPILTHGGENGNYRMYLSLAFAG